jgi:hypothetical protein
MSSKGRPKGRLNTGNKVKWLKLSDFVSHFLNKLIKIIKLIKRVIIKAAIIK